MFKRQRTEPTFKRVKVDVYGGINSYELEKLQRAAAHFTDHELYFVQAGAQVPPESRELSGVALSDSAFWLMSDVAEVAVLCGQQHRSKIRRNKPVVILDMDYVDDTSDLDDTSGSDEEKPLRVVRPRGDYAEKAVRQICDLATSCSRGIVTLQEAERSAWLLVRAHCFKTSVPWLSMDEFVRVSGSVDAAQRFIELKLVAKLKSDVVSVDLCWLFDLLRRIRIPAVYGSTCTNFMWHHICVDRLLDRKLLDVLWHEDVLQCDAAAAPALREAIVSYFECTGVLGPRVSAQGICSDLWPVPHLIWSTSIPQEDIDADLGLKGWRVQRAVRHCLRRRIVIDSAATFSPLWRDVVTVLSRLSRCLVFISLGWIEVQALDNSETVVIIARTAQLVVHTVDVMAYYPAVDRGDEMRFGLFTILMTVVEESCAKYNGKPLVTVPLIRNGSSVCVALATLRDLEAGVGNGQVLLERENVCSLLAPREVHGVWKPTFEAAAVAAHLPRKNALVTEVTWRSYIEWRDIACAVDASVALHDVVCKYVAGRESEVVKPVGKGGFGAVWHAVWRGREVAVKVEIRERQNFMELAILQAVRAHPNIVQLLGFCTDPEAIVMEYVPAVGNSAVLASWLKSPFFFEARESELANLAAHACSALAYVHSINVLHADIKSSNALITRNAEGWVLKISDFGVSVELKAVEGKIECVKSYAVGTRGHQAPEQCIPCKYNFSKDRREFVLTAKADVWGFGSLLLRLFSDCDNSASVVVCQKDTAFETEKISSFLNAYDEDFRADTELHGSKMRRSMLFANGCRRRNLPTPVLVLAEWCVRVKPEDRPTMEQVLNLLNVLRDNFAAAEAQGVSDVWLGELTADAAAQDSAEAFVRGTVVEERNDLFELLWKAAVAAWAEDAKRVGVVMTTPTVFIGLPCRFIVEVVDRCMPLDDEARAALTAFLDNNGVSRKRLRRCLQSCDSLAALVAQARSPFYSAPLRTLGPFIGYKEELEYVCQELRQSVAKFQPVRVTGARDVPLRIMAVTGDRGCGKSRFALEVAHKLHKESPRLFDGGIVHVSAVAPLTHHSLFHALCDAVHIPCSEPEYSFRRWCAQKSARGNVLLVVDGGTNDVWEMAQHLWSCLFQDYDMNSAFVPNGMEFECVPQPCRVFVLAAGMMPKSYCTLFTKLEAEPRVVSRLCGLQTTDASCLAQHLGLNRPVYSLPRCPRELHILARGASSALSPSERTVLTQLRAWRAPFSVAAAVFVCGACAPELLSSLEDKEMLVRISAELWQVTALACDFKTSSAEDVSCRDAACAAFVKYYCAVLTVYADETATCTETCQQRCDAEWQSVVHLLDLARVAVTQADVVRCELARLCESAYVADVLDDALSSPNDFFSALSALWLSTWMLPRTPANARSLAQISLCLSFALELAGGQMSNLQSLAFLGLEIAERILAASDSDSTCDAELSLQRLQRDGLLVARASNTFGKLLSDSEKDNTFPEKASVEFAHLLAHTAGRLQVLQSRYPFSQRLRELQINSGVFFNLPVVWHTKLEDELDMRAPLVPCVSSSDVSARCFWREEGLSRPIIALLLKCKALASLLLYGDACNPMVTDVWINTGFLLRDCCSRQQAAIVVLNHTIALEAQTLSAHSPQTCRALRLCAGAYRLMNDRKRAVDVYQQCLDMCRVVFGAAHRETSRVLSLYAFALYDDNKLWQSLRTYQELIDNRASDTGCCLNTASALYNKAIVMNKIVMQGAKAYEAPEALQPPLTFKDVACLYARCAAIRFRNNFVHPDNAAALDSLAVVYYRMGEKKTSLKLLERCENIYSELGRRDDVAKCQYKMGVMRGASEPATALQNFLSCLNTQLEIKGVEAETAVRITLRDVSSFMHIVIARNEPGLYMRTIWLDRNLQVLADIARGSKESSALISPSPVASRFRYAVNILQLAPQLTDGDVALNMIGMGFSLLAVLARSVTPHLLHVARKSTATTVVVAEAQLAEKTTDRERKDAALAHNNAGEMFLLRGLYDDAAAEFSRAVELLANTKNEPKEYYLKALLNCTEAVVRTDCMRAFNIYKLAYDTFREWKECPAATAPMFRRKFLLLQQRLLSYADDDDDDDDDNSFPLISTWMAARLLDLNLQAQSSVCAYLKARV